MNYFNIQMINNALLNPDSISIIGASNNLQKPGGGLVKNLVDGGYCGEIYPVNPKEKKIQNIKAYNKLDELPDNDLAILAISAEQCVTTIEYLASNKNTKAFIIISAGFSEMGEEGRILEERIKKISIDKELSVIGPNCIGVTNINYKAIFVSPPPEIKEGGVDFVSASGALAVFLFETAAVHGLKFGNVFTVGNSTTIGVEEVIAHWDVEYRPGLSSSIKMIYVEQISKPDLFYKHIFSLREKGCEVIVAKPGESEAGARAALSHTGALAGDSEAINMLIEKAGAIRCYSREEMIHIACILSQKKLSGKKLAIVTHAGGPGVMLTDRLQKYGFEIPELDVDTQNTLLEILNPGSSALNPVDMLATANREQLTEVLKSCANLDYIDGVIIIYGKTGMEDLNQTYSKMAETILQLDKPVYTIMPSVNSGSEEIKKYLSYNLPTFFDEVVLADALFKAHESPKIFRNELLIPVFHEKEMRHTALPEEETAERLKWAGIPHVQTEFIYCESDLSLCDNINFPVVAKVLGILHKTEVDGVILNINTNTELKAAFEILSSIPGSKGMLVQEMIQGTELYLGAKMHENIGFSVHAGVGGIFLELIRDVKARLAPIDVHEAHEMLSTLKSQKIFQGFRNMTPVDASAFAHLIATFSRIFQQYPDIREIDLNPLIANGEHITAVDARIII